QRGHRQIGAADVVAYLPAIERLARLPVIRRPDYGEALVSDNPQIPSGGDGADDALQKKDIDAARAALSLPGITVLDRLDAVENAPIVHRAQQLEVFGV